MMFIITFVVQTFGSGGSSLRNAKKNPGMVRQLFGIHL